MTVRFTLKDGDTYTVSSVESIRLIDSTTVEIKTFGNTPALNRGIRTFDVTYTAEDNAS